MTRQERLEKRIRAEWRPLLEKMQAVAQEHGMQIEERNPCAPEYQICRMTCDGVRLVVYPHKANTGNQHARVRSENSSNAAKADEMMKLVGLWVNNRGLP